MNSGFKCEDKNVHAASANIIKKFKARDNVMEN
jgi:hypothetical protein